MTAQELPLFPLNTVLFPGGPLSLRIFETRYLDMVSECMKSGRGFGVVLLDEGEEAGPGPTRFQTIGTLARIVDFDRLEDGLLGITCRGGRRFRVLSHRVRSDRLVMGQVELWSAEPRLEVPEHHRILVDFMKELLGRSELRGYARLIGDDWNNAAWLGFRLAEMLPLAATARQTLLELTDPGQRLDVLSAILHKQESN